MNNKNMLPKERNLIKGAIRRVFSRSDLRKIALAASRIEHTDPTRPRVKKWSLCPLCSQKTPTYLMEVDHVVPIIPVNSSLELMSWDTVINNTWCDPNNLLAICELCHDKKTAVEREARKLNKKKEQESNGKPTKRSKKTA